MTYLCTSKSIFQDLQCISSISLFLNIVSSITSPYSDVVSLLSILFPHTPLKQISNPDQLLPLNLILHFYFPSLIFIYSLNKTNRMSFWYSTDKQREVHLMKQRYLSNILQYNKQQIEEKQHRKKIESKSFMEHSQRYNQEAINDLMVENNRQLRKKEEEKQMLKDCYERQMQERVRRMKEEKQKDVLYAHRLRERMDFEEDRRIFELSKMFNRVTYQGSPNPIHRRVKTQSYEPQYDTNPERKQSQTPSNQKNLNNIEINLLPPHQSNRNVAALEQEADSLDNLNYSFHQNDTPKKY